MFERKIISKKEKILDQENSQLIIQSLDFSQGLQSDVNALQTDVNTLQTEMDQAQTDINALPTQSDVNAKISDVAYNQSTWNAVTTIAPSKNTVRDKFESLSLGSKKGTLTLNIENWSGVFSSSYLDWNSEAEFLVTSFRVTDNMSASHDMKIIVTCAEPFGTSQSASIKWYVSATKTDNTEALSWNILNGITQSLASSANNVLITLTKTIAHADFDQDDVVRIYILNNSAADVNIYNLSLEYTEA